MYAVAYLCSKLGKVGRDCLRSSGSTIPSGCSTIFLVTAVVGNVIEAGADLGGMAAAHNEIVLIPISGMVVILGVSVLS
jgi:Mn2+/Fe2+ NRAMP family transporter